MRDIDETTKADALLMEHYYWQKSWRPAIGYGNVAPECRQAKSNRVMDTFDEVNGDAIKNLEMEAVEWCLDAVTPECRQAIGKEMKNREAKAQVWRSPSPLSYPEAVAVIMPLMRKKDLI